MRDYRLYCFAESGNAYKAALMLQFCQLEWTPVKVDYFAGETRRKDFRANVNELGEAPVLVHGEQKLSQSGVILQYISDQSGKFGGANQQEKYEILRWLLFDNHKFTSYIATHRFMLTFMDTGETEVTEFMKGRAIGALEIVDKHLRNRDFVATTQMSIADISMCAYLFYGDELGVDLSAYKNVMAWLDRIKSFPRWVAPYELMPVSYKACATV
jgi:glutathione S-transferase